MNPNLSPQTLVCGRDKRETFPAFKQTARKSRAALAEHAAERILETAFKSDSVTESLLAYCVEQAKGNFGVSLPGCYAHTRGPLIHPCVIPDNRISQLHQCLSQMPLVQPSMSLHCMCMQILQKPSSFALPWTMHTCICDNCYAAFRRGLSRSQLSQY